MMAVAFPDGCAARPIADRVAIMRAVHGIVLGEWTCPACGRRSEVDDYPSNECVGCGRPYQTRCHGGVDEQLPQCSTYVDPVQTTSGDGRHASVSWAPRLYCDSCRDQMRTRGLRAIYQREVPERERVCAARWKSYEHRSEAASFFSSWLDDGMGDGAGIRMVYVWGSAGAGKSVLAARCAWHALQRGIVRTVTWVTEQELQRLVIERVKRTPEAEAAQQRISQILGADLLVLDELFSRCHSGPPKAESYDGLLRDGGYQSDYVRRSVAEVLKAALDRGQRVIATSNRNPDVQLAGSLGTVSIWSIVGDNLIASRAHDRVKAVRCVGPDLRAASKAGA